MVGMPPWIVLFADGALAQVFLVAAILMVIITLMMRLYRYQSRQKRKGPAFPSRSRAERGDRGLRAGAPAEIVRWEVQMQELARDLKAEIESKMVALGQLIADADRAARRLEAGLQSGEDSRAGSPKPPSDREEPRGAAKASEEVDQEIFMLADYGFPLPDIANRVGIPVDRIELILRRRRRSQ